MLAVAAAVYGGAALAQQAQPEPAAAPAGQTQLTEVVVTAQYRQENLQTTPLAITAITTQQLEARSFTNVNNLGLSVPNAYFRPPVSNYGPTETIGIRGITQVDYSYSFEPAVAVYIGDIYHGTMTGSSMDLADMQRVEVLRGPQGTLFGKNALGGAIRMIPNKPKGSDTGWVEVTYGQRHHIDLKGMADVSLIDQKLYARIVAVSRTQDGVGKYLDFACEMAARGTPQLSGSLPETVTPTQGNGCALGSLGGYDHKSVRAELRWLVSDKLEINFSADYTKQADDPPLQTLLTGYGGPSDTFNNGYSAAVVFPKFGINYTNNPNFLSPSPWDNYATFGDAVTGQKYDPTQYLHEGGESITADYHFTDNIQLKVIGAYRNYQANWINDSDLTPFGLTQTYNQQEHRQFQGEARLSGTSFAGRFDWTAGVFYYDSKDRDYYPTNFDAFALPLPPIFPGGLLANFTANDYYRDKNKSVFLHGNYKLTDRWSITAGVRYTDENKGNLFQHVSDYPPQSVVIPYWKKITATRFDYSGSVNFQATSAMLFYGSVATGFRSPGFNPRISTPGQLVEVPGEEATDYELGAKLDFFDHRLRVNSDVFYMDYKKHLNLQLGTQCNAATDPDAGTPYFGITTCPPGTPLAGTPGLSPWFVYTVAPANIRGFEVEVSALPIDGLTVNFSAGYNRLHSKTSDPTVVGYINSSVREQPSLNMSGGVQYAIPIGTAGASLTPRLDWFYQGYATNGPVADPQIRPDWIVPGYSLFNARITYTPSSAGWSLAFAATNLFNKFYWQQLGAATTMSPSGALSPAVARVGTPGMPREWTITFRKNFD